MRLPCTLHHSIPRLIVVCIGAFEGAVALWLLLKSLHYMCMFWGIFKNALQDAAYIMQHRSELYQIGKESLDALKPESFPFQRIALDCAGMCSVVLIGFGLIIAWWCVVGIYRAIGRCFLQD